MTLTPQEIFRGHSTTYYYASRFLPQKMREQVEVLYAFVRIPDEYVDNKQKKPEKYYKYKQDWERKTSKIPVVKHFKQVQQEVGIEDEWVRSFFGSMEMDLDKEKYTTQRELDKYIYGSAEVIGLMMCRILQISEEWYEEAKGLGWFMQYVNMLRDIKEDFDNNLVYIPQEKLKEYNVTSLEQALYEKDKALCNLVKDEATRALQTYNEDVKEGINAIPYTLRIAVQTAADMYVWTAKELQRDTQRAIKTKKIPNRVHVFTKGIANIVTCYKN